MPKTVTETSPPKRRNFSHFASQVAQWCGSPYASGAAAAIVLLWAASGPFFNFSSNWQIVINTGTTIVTFLMVFVIQSSQNRDGLALQLKLNEIIRALEGARNTMVVAEGMDEQELKKLQSSFQDLAQAEMSSGVQTSTGKLVDLSATVSAARAPKARRPRARKKNP